MRVNIRQHLPSRTSRSSRLFASSKRWWKSMSFVLHVSAICKPILAPAVWFIIGAPWNAFELCLPEPNSVIMQPCTYRHRDLSAFSFGSCAQKDASTQSTTRPWAHWFTKFIIVYFQSCIPYMMLCLLSMFLCGTNCFLYFGIWIHYNDRFSVIKTICVRGYKKKSEYFLTNSHIYTDLSLDIPGSTGPSLCTSFHHFINGFKLCFEGSWKQKGS